MLKFLLIICIITYLVYKVGSFFFRAGAASQHFRNYQQQQRKTFNGNTHGDPQYPNEKKRSGKYKGGEYVDYEEVK
jgi:hypothetical protein